MANSRKKSSVDIRVGLGRKLVDCARLNFKASLLERELEITKAELFDARLEKVKLEKQANLSSGEKLELAAFLRSQAVQELILADAGKNWAALVIQEYESSKNNLATVFFDRPLPLQITVKYKDFPLRMFDLVKSVRKDFNNIAHPIVLHAVRRYALAASPASFGDSNQRKTTAAARGLSPTLARKNLDRLLRAVKFGVEHYKQPNRDSLYALQTSLLKFPPDYLASVWRILRDPEVKKARRLETKIRIVDQKLKMEYPGVDSELVLNYLSDGFSVDSFTKIPQRGSSEALRNAICAWQYGIAPESMSAYASRGRRFLKEISEGLDNSQIEKALASFDADGFTRDFLLVSLGIGSLRPYADVATLVEIS